MKKLSRWILILSLLLAPSLFAAEAEPLQSGIFTGDLTVEVETFDLSQPLSLDEVTRLGLARNLQIDMSKIKPLIDLLKDNNGKLLKETQKQKILRLNGVPSQPDVKEEERDGTV